MEVEIGSALVTVTNPAAEVEEVDAVVELEVEFEDPVMTFGACPTRAPVPWYQHRPSKERRREG